MMRTSRQVLLPRRPFPALNLSCSHAIYNSAISTCRYTGAVYQWCATCSDRSTDAFVSTSFGPRTVFRAYPRAPREIDNFERFEVFDEPLMKFRDPRGGTDPRVAHHRRTRNNDTCTRPPDPPDHDFV